MFNIAEETFLFEYFVMEAMLGKHCEKERLFRELGQTLALCAEEIEALFKAVGNATACGVLSEADYYRCMRIKEYQKMVGAPAPFTEEEEDLITMKGEAILYAKERRLLPPENATATLVFKQLINCASGGVIAALRVLGILQCSGISMKQDLASGVKNLAKAACWGDVVSAVALLRYASADRERHLSRFLACVKDTPYEYLREVAEGCDAVRADPDVRLLRKCIAVGKANAEVYNPSVARVAFSGVIDDEDKEALIFSENREMVSVACELPLSLAYRPLRADRAALEAGSLGRKTEVDEIMKNLANIDLRAGSVYTPICLSSDSRFVRDRYFEAIKGAFPEAHIHKIEVKNLTPGDLEPTKNNIFLRSLVEKKANVWVLVFDEKVEDAVFDQVVTLLNGEKRSRFRINLPGVTVDLGSVLPICLCDRDHQRRLGKYAEVLQIKPLDRKERLFMVGRLYEERCGKYGIAEGALREEVAASLADMNIDTADKVLEKLLLENRSTLGGREIDMEIASPYLTGKSGGDFGYGFGGNLK